MKTHYNDEAVFDANRTLNWDEASLILGCTPKTLRVWASKRKVPHTKVGRLTRFRMKDLEDWMDKNTVQADVA
jgi:excisionase family DNA binding protein